MVNLGEKTQENFYDGNYLSKDVSVKLYLKENRGESFTSISLQV